ncbi:uncharacterized protein DUF3540 [Pseudacidovorax intermedius]|uniref:Uncharacterized protein DUF3540 n=1 Tax=Pseudacidovorax intermedius TaxID=433924 RepID=A0A370FRG8_9BURK|nr:DUF3540 domain-containing protein [Pseudacidovorax intermedius]RDI29494.1 uncharacterized protein DUF3540 [Pseudacidovorax intermedius]
MSPSPRAAARPSSPSPSAATASRAAKAIDAEWCVGVVTASGAEGLAVVSGGLQAQARRAVGCLLAPRSGDTVACLRVAPAQWWVMNVLQRDESDAPHLLSLPGDALLQAEGGTLSLQAEALDLRAGRSLAITAPQAQVAVDGADVVGRQLRVSAGVLKLVGSVLSTVMERVQHHSRHYLRRTEGLDQVHATHLNCEAEQTLRLSGEHALVNGEKLVKARGAQIHFG